MACVCCFQRVLTNLKGDKCQKPKQLQNVVFPGMSLSKHLAYCPCFIHRVKSPRTWTFPKPPCVIGLLMAHHTAGMNGTTSGSTVSNLPPGWAATAKPDTNRPRNLRMGKGFVCAAMKSSKSKMQRSILSKASSVSSGENARSVEGSSIVVCGMLARQNYLKIKLFLRFSHEVQG